MSAPARVARDTLRAYSAWSRIELSAAAARHRPRVVRRPIGPGRRVLLIATSFPPVVTGGTYRPLALARYGTELGWEISVLASEPPSLTAAGRYLAQQVPAQVRVIRRPASPALPHARGVPRIDGTLARALNLYEIGRRAVRVGRPDFVVASGPPFDQFVTARYLAHALGSRLVLDYRDEWTQCPFDFVERGRLDTLWERRCLNAADLVIFTTRSQLEHQLEVFPALERRRCEVVENGWEPADHATSAPASASPSERALSIAFVGTFPAFTPPGGFLATVEAAVRARPDLKAQLRILLVGRKHPSVLEPLQRFAHAEMLECIGEVPRPQAIRIMRSASALLLFNPPELARYVPGKLYEYLAARRPILVFGNGGEAATLVQELAAGVTIEPGDFKSLTRAVDGLAAGTLRRPSGAEINSWLAAHTRERMTAQFFAVLEALPRS